MSFFEGDFEELAKVGVVNRSLESRLEVGIVSEVSRATALVEEFLKLVRKAVAERCGVAKRHRLVAWVDAEELDEAVRRALQVIASALLDANVSCTRRVNRCPDELVMLRKRNAFTVGGVEALGQAEVLRCGEGQKRTEKGGREGKDTHDEEDPVGSIAVSATDVRRLDVTVKNALGVYVFEAVHEHHANVEGVSDWQALSDRVELFRKRWAEEVHGQAVVVVLDPGPAQSRNILVTSRVGE